MEKGSASKQFSWDDTLKTLKASVMAFFAGLLLLLGEQLVAYLNQLPQAVDFGLWKPLVFSVCGLLATALTKWLSDTRRTEIKAKDKKYNVIGSGTLPVLLLILLLPVLFIGCAQSNRKDIVISSVGADVWIRSIAADNQRLEPGAGTDIALETPGAGEIPPIAGSYFGRGMFAGHSVLIQNVTGSVYIEEAGNRNQGIDIPGLIEKLYEPGDPFSITYVEEPE